METDSNGQPATSPIRKNNGDSRADSNGREERRIAVKHRRKKRENQITLKPKGTPALIDTYAKLR